MLELTSGLANHRGLAPRDGITWHDLGRGEQTFSYSIPGQGGRPGEGHILLPCRGSYSRRWDHSTEKYQRLCTGEFNLTGRQACKTHQSLVLEGFLQGARHGHRNLETLNINHGFSESLHIEGTRNPLHTILPGLGCRRNAQDSCLWTNSYVY